MLSRKISKRSSPVAEMSVCPVSGSVLKRDAGSTETSHCSVTTSALGRRWCRTRYRNHRVRKRRWRYKSKQRHLQGLVNGTFGNHFSLAISLQKGFAADSSFFRPLSAGKMFSYANDPNLASVLRCNFYRLGV